MQLCVFCSSNRCRYPLGAIIVAEGHGALLGLALASTVELEGRKEVMRDQGWALGLVESMADPMQRLGQIMAEVDRMVVGGMDGIGKGWDRTFVLLRHALCEHRSMRRRQTVNAAHRCEGPDEP